MAEPKRGRPPLDTSSPSTDVHLTISTSDYDRLQERAKKDRVESIQEVIRHGIKRLLTDDSA